MILKCCVPEHNGKDSSRFSHGYGISIVELGSANSYPSSQEMLHLSVKQLITA